jgi:hypothetical protein
LRRGYQTFDPGYGSKINERQVQTNILLVSPSIVKQGYQSAVEA